MAGPDEASAGSATDRRSFLKYAVAGAAAAGVAAVGASAYYKYSYAPSQARFEAAQVRLGFSGPDIVEAPWLVANDMGIFKKYNIETELIPFSSLGGMLDAFQASKIDLCSSALPQIISLAVGANVYGRLIHTEGWTGTYQGKVYPQGVAMVRSALADSVKSIKDLKGKTIATLGLTTFNWVVSQVVLLKAGINPSTDIKVVSLSQPAMLEAFATNNIDAALSVPIPYYLEALDKGYAKVINDPVYDPNGITYVNAVGTPIVPINGLFANDAFLNLYPNACAGLTRAVADGISFIQSNPDQTVSIMSKHVNLSVDVLRRGLSAVLFLPYPSGFTDWQTYFLPIEKIMVDNKVLKQSIDLKPFLTTPCFKP